MRPTEDGPNFTRRSYFALVSARLGAFFADVISEIPITDEFLDFILEHDALLCGMANILVISVILILISFGAISYQRIRSFVDAYLLGGQKDFLTRLS